MDRISSTSATRRRLPHWLAALALGACATAPPGVHEQLDPLTGLGEIVILADGEPLPLETAGWTLDAIGVSEPPYSKPMASALEIYYPLTLDQVRVIAEATDLRLQTTSTAMETFELWDTRDPGLAAIRVFAACR